MKIDALKFGLAAGILWGACVFVMTLLALTTGFGTDFVNALSKIYLFNSISVVGSIIGLVEGFIDGFVGCWLFITIYNAL